MRSPISLLLVAVLLALYCLSSVSSQAIAVASEELSIQAECVSRSSSSSVKCNASSMRSDDVMIDEIIIVPAALVPVKTFSDQNVIIPVQTSAAYGQVSFSYSLMCSVAILLVIFF